MRILGSAVIHDIHDLWKRKTLPMEDAENLELLPAPGRIDPETIIMLDQVSARLPQPQQRILELWRKGRTVPEIAEALEIPESRVKRERDEIKKALRYAFTETTFPQDQKKSEKS